MQEMFPQKSKEMSVVSELYKVTVVGDGSTPSIAFNRKVFASSDIKGVKYDTTTLAETALVNGSDFTVSGAGNESTGVTITPSSSIPSGTNWVMYSDQGSTQTTDLQSQGPFPANTIEYMVDKLAIAIQEVEGKVDRALLMPLFSSASKTIPDGTDKVVVLDSSGDLGTVNQSGFGDAITTLTTKADLLVHDGTDLDRLPVGSNNQVLTADSTQTLGVKWAAASGGITHEGFMASVGTTLTNVTGDGTIYTVQFNTEEYDALGSWDATSTFTAQGAGQFQFGGQITLDGLDADTYERARIQILHNGGFDNIITNWINIDNVDIASSGQATMQIPTCILNMSASDTVTVTLFVDNGTKSVGVSGNVSFERSSFFWANKVSEA